MTEWKQYRIGELVDLSQGQVINAQTNHLVVKEGIPLLRITDMINGTKNIFIDEHKVSPKNVAAPEDIIFTRTGQVGLVFKKQFGVIHNNCFKVIPKIVTLDRIFLYWFLKTNAIYEYVNGVASGSAQPDLPHGAFKSITILLPPLSTQQRIASILSAYDDLIEVNNQRIKLLEETARELYKEWFVRMRFPGYKEAKFKKGTPNDWEIVTVEEAFTTTGGGTPDTTNEAYWNGEVNWYSPTDITASQTFFLNESKDKITEKGLKESSAKLFPAGCLMMTSRATIAAVGINTTPACTNQGFITCLPNEQFPCEYLYFWILSNKEYFEMLASGATFLEISRTTFRKIKILKPESEIIAKYKSLVEPAFKQIENLQNQNIELRQIRDRLLPRLISGKLQVKVPSEARVIPINQAPSLIAPEQEGSYSRKGNPNPYFTRRVLAAYLIDKLHQEITFGHVKLMKLMYLCEHVAGIETVSHYHRDAAGPYDNQMIRSIDSQLKKAKWFECKNEKGRFVYYPLTKKEEYKEWFAKYYNHEQAGIDQLIDLFGRKKTEEVEIIATLLEAHRHLISASGKATDDAVVHEVFNNWHESKKRIEETRWRQGLVWMRQRNWIS